MLWALCFFRQEHCLLGLLITPNTRGSWWWVDPVEMRNYPSCPISPQKKGGKKRLYLNLFDYKDVLQKHTHTAKWNQILFSCSLHIQLASSYWLKTHSLNIFLSRKATPPVSIFSSLYHGEVAFPRAINSTSSILFCRQAHWLQRKTASTAQHIGRNARIQF